MFSTKADADPVKTEITFVARAPSPASAIHKQAVMLRRLSAEASRAQLRPTPITASCQRADGPR